MKTSSSEDWQTLKSSMDAVMKDMQEAYEQAVTEFN